VYAVEFIEGGPVLRFIGSFQIGEGRMSSFRFLLYGGVLCGTTMVCAASGAPADSGKVDMTLTGSIEFARAKSDHTNQHEWLGEVLVHLHTMAIDLGGPSPQKLETSLYVPEWGEAALGEPKRDVLFSRPRQPWVLDGTYCKANRSKRDQITFWKIFTRDHVLNLTPFLGSDGKINCVVHSRPDVPSKPGSTNDKSGEQFDCTGVNYSKGNPHTTEMLGHILNREYGYEKGQRWNLKAVQAEHAQHSWVFHVAQEGVGDAAVYRLVQHGTDTDKKCSAWRIQGDRGSENFGSILDSCGEIDEDAIVEKLGKDIVGFKPKTLVFETHVPWTFTMRVCEPIFSSAELEVAKNVISDGLREIDVKYQKKAKREITEDCASKVSTSLQGEVKKIIDGTFKDGERVPLSVRVTECIATPRETTTAEKRRIEKEKRMERGKFVVESRYKEHKPDEKRLMQYATSLGADLCNALAGWEEMDPKVVYKMLTNSKFERRMHNEGYLPIEIQAVAAEIARDYERTWKHNRNFFKCHEPDKNSCVKSYEKPKYTSLEYKNSLGGVLQTRKTKEGKEEWVGSELLCCRQREDQEDDGVARFASMCFVQPRRGELKEGDKARTWVAPCRSPYDEHKNWVNRGIMTGELAVQDTRSQNEDECGKIGQIYVAAFKQVASHSSHLLLAAVVKFSESEKTEWPLWYRQIAANEKVVDRREIPSIKKSMAREDEKDDWSYVAAFPRSGEEQLIAPFPEAPPVRHLHLPAGIAFDGRSGSNNMWSAPCMANLQNFGEGQRCSEALSALQEEWGYEIDATTACYVRGSQSSLDYTEIGDEPNECEDIILGKGYEHIGCCQQAQLQLEALQNDGSDVLKWQKSALRSEDAADTPIRDDSGAHLFGLFKKGTHSADAGINFQPGEHTHGNVVNMRFVLTLATEDELKRMTALKLVPDLVSESRFRMRQSVVLSRIKPLPTKIVDPRHKGNGQKMDVIAFRGLKNKDGVAEDFDKECGCAFLGNYWESSLSISAPPDARRPPSGWQELFPKETHPVLHRVLPLENYRVALRSDKIFRNAEAAFHSFKYWWLVDQDGDHVFSNMSGSEAAVVQRKLGDTDPEVRKAAPVYELYANQFYHAERDKESADMVGDDRHKGYGGRGDDGEGSWKAMWRVLQAKFACTALRQGLAETKDAFLLHHHSHWLWGDAVTTEDDGYDFLGIQLMLLRDSILKSEKEGSWTSFFEPYLHVHEEQWKEFGNWKEGVAASKTGLAKVIREIRNGVFGASGAPGGKGGKGGALSSAGGGNQKSSVSAGRGVTTEEPTETCVSSGIECADHETRNDEHPCENKKTCTHLECCNPTEQGFFEKNKVALIICVCLCCCVVIAFVFIGFLMTQEGEAEEGGTAFSSDEEQGDPDLPVDDAEIGKLSQRSAKSSKYGGTDSGPGGEDGAVDSDGPAEGGGGDEEAPKEEGQEE